MAVIEPDVMAQHARSLELQAAVARLLGILFPGHPPGTTSAGRYALLHGLLERNPKLLTALVDASNPRRIVELWQEALLDGAIDVRVLHLLAVVFREQAIAAQSNGGGRTDAEVEAVGGLWRSSTCLWVLLLSSDPFWEYFATNRLTSREGERLPLDPDDQHDLIEAAARSVLSPHATLGARDLAAGRRAWATVHARCLDLARSPATSLVKALEDFGLIFPCAPAEARLASIGQLAKDALDTWAQGVVRDAEKEVNDPEIIATLPEGIRKNYAGGVKRLEAFSALGVPVARILRTSLEWYNEWCHCLYTLQQVDEIKKILKPACALADALAPLCEQGRGFEPSSQALSTHFMLRGFVAADPAEAQRHYAVAQQWNDANDNARQLAAGARRQQVHEQLGETAKLIEAKKFDKAYAALDKLGEVDDKEALESVRQARAAVCFRHTMALAEEGHFRKALDRAREAAKLDPDEEAIKKLVDQMAELAPDEENLRHLRAAKEAMDKDRFDDVITHASKVDRSSKFAGQARNLQSAACFRRGIASAQKEKLDDALRDLRQALGLNENPEEQAVIKKQIGMLEQAEIGHGLKSAFERRNWGSAEHYLRRALGQDELPRKVRKTLQSQLSMVLNAQAVELANRIPAERDEKGKKARQMVETFIHSKGVSDVTDLPQSEVAELLKLISKPDDDPFGPNLFTTPDSSKDRAVMMLEEAIKLDSGNAAAKKNLQAIKRL